MAAPTILFRKDYSTEDELDIAKQYFHVVEYRAECQDQLVIPRYSALPYYKELEYDLLLHNCHMINSLREHRWIADFEWYNELREFTPETWFDHNFHECTHHGPFVVKGRTNSKKLYWSSQMFAPTRRDAIKVAGLLTQNEYLAQQGIVYRKYEPLVTLEEGLNGLPFSHEFRFFFLRNKMLCNGFYWSSASRVDYPTPEAAIELAHKVAGIAMQYANFFVVDVAEKASGGWTLIELNDGQMSGLSECDPHELYKNLAESLITLDEASDG